MEQVIHFLKHHWLEIGFVWLTLQNVLKGIQDSLDAIPKDAPFLTKIVAVMSGASRYLFAGTRPTIKSQGQI